MSPHPPAVADIAGREDRLIMDTYRRQPVELVRGDGFLLYDREGKEYLDFVAGLAVNVVGHGNAKVAEAIGRQARALVHVSDLYYTRPQVDLAQRLNDLGFVGRAFFANSGAEANEAAIKIARKWGQLNRNGAYEVIATENSFHGRTLAAIAATGQPKYQAPFVPMPEGFKHVPFNDIEALRAAVSPKTAAILLEPIQGESGVIPADMDYLRAVRELCDDENLLLILDEIQTGIGRTGTFYAFQAYGIVPDVVTLAKGLGGGCRSASAWPARGRTCWGLATTARRSAASRWPAPPRWPRSRSSTRRAWSRTPGSPASTCRRRWAPVCPPSASFAAGD